jgi:hypothetical protein
MAARGSKAGGALSAGWAEVQAFQQATAETLAGLAHSEAHQRAMDEAFADMGIRGGVTVVPSEGSQTVTIEPVNMELELGGDPGDFTDAYKERRAGERLIQLKERFYQTVRHLHALRVLTVDQAIEVLRKHGFGKSLPEQTTTVIYDAPKAGRVSVVLTGTELTKDEIESKVTGRYPNPAHDEVKALFGEGAGVDNTTPRSLVTVVSVQTQLTWPARSEFSPAKGKASK